MSKQIKIERLYKKLILTSHHMLTLQLESSDECPVTLAMINKLVEMALPSTYSEHCDFILLIENCIKRMAYMPSNVSFYSEFRDSSLSVLHKKISNDNEKEHLESQGYHVPYPFLLLPNEDVNPTLDVKAACLEMLELNKFILDEFIEDYDFIFHTR